MSDDETYVRRAIGLAERAAERGDPPFGSLLVTDSDVGDDERVRRTATNTQVSDGDPTAHPELELARWAGRHLEPDERSECTLYTSAEPCPMCAGAIHYADIGRVVFSVGRPALRERADGPVLDHRCADVVAPAGHDSPAVTVDGPLLEAEGLAVFDSTNDG